MPTDENKAALRSLIAEFWNRGNTAVATELVAEDHVGLERPPEHQGRVGLIAINARLRTAFPDLEWTIEEQVAEADKVASYLVWRGTHLGVFQGIPPTGKRVTVPCMAIDYFVAGQCKKSRMLMDTMSLMQQLGVIPAPAQAS